MTTTTTKTFKLLCLITDQKHPHSPGQYLNFGVHTAWRKARDRDVWHQVVSTATLHSGSEFIKKEEERWSGETQK